MIAHTRHVQVYCPLSNHILCDPVMVIDVGSLVAGYLLVAAVSCVLKPQYREVDHGEVFTSESRRRFSAVDRR